MSVTWRDPRGWEQANGPAVTDRLRDWQRRDVDFWPPVRLLVAGLLVGLVVGLVVGTVLL